MSDDKQQIKLDPAWRDVLSPREYQMIVAAKLYTEVTPNAGLPGAGMLALIYKLATIINKATEQGMNILSMIDPPADSGKQ